MKILIIKKKLLINLLLYLIVAITLSAVIIYFTSIKYKSIQTISPVNISQTPPIDLTGDGQKDSLQLSNAENKIDLNITCSNDSFSLSNQIKDKTLFNTNTHWEPKIYLHDISRDNIPEIILQGSKNNKSACYVFHWNKKNFALVYSSNNNIFGILDCKNSKTPQCYSLSSSEGLSSLNSFMLINDYTLDTSKENSSVPSLDSVTNFINIVELPYILDNLPDIFTSAIDKENLSLLWSLDKDNYSYSFQNGFFYDYKWTQSGEPYAIRWRLSFEKSNLKGTLSNKTEFILIIDLEKTGSTYKINSIQKVK
ncbi:hypothetical protein [Clostridium sp.]|uniref:hypothetical protein n=1 Tax=Clostridium sp. TaxID=1506 RepID=UPI00283EFE34|nr:hypothetical protein [Clostridium sp.]MDR3596391.1 hypothetical protein [Clostridium sp.]